VLFHLGQLGDFISFVNSRGGGAGHTYRIGWHGWRNLGCCADSPRALQDKKMAVNLHYISIFRGCNLGKNLREYVSWIGGLAPDQNQKDDTMSNYTPAMVAKLQEAAPLNLEKAKALASEFGNVTHRSVISKAKSLGLEYVAQPKRVAAAKRVGPTKAETLGAIRKALALPEREGDLTKAELESVLESIG
jgi:hypothetical protein